MIGAIKSMNLPEKLCGECLMAIAKSMEEDLGVVELMFIPYMMQQLRAVPNSRLVQNTKSNPFSPPGRLVSTFRRISDEFS
jgi:hypothetical protein